MVPENKTGATGTGDGELHDVPTCDLVDELATRLGVTATIIGPYEHETFEVDGPAIVLVVTD